MILELTNGAYIATTEIDATNDKDSGNENIASIIRIKFNQNMKDTKVSYIAIIVSLTFLGYDIDTHSIALAGFAIYILLVLINLAHSVKKVKYLDYSLTRK